MLFRSRRVDTARALARRLREAGLPVVGVGDDLTDSHHIAVATPDGGQRAAARLRDSNLLACGIGLPGARVPGGVVPDGDVPGLRLGTPEMVRWGMGPEEAERVADWIARALLDGEDVSAEVTEFRTAYDRVHFVRGGPLSPR
mgnify:FL=1